MNLHFSLKENRTSFAPGDTIAGTAMWTAETAPRTAEVRLCWFTRGKGTEDAEVVSTVVFDEPMAEGNRTFQFQAPAQPYSFSGLLISLLWAVELVIQPGEHFRRIEIVIAPSGLEVDLCK